MLTDITPDRLARCSKALADLESATAAILIGRWIPADAESLALSIRCVNDNLHRVKSDVAAALDVVLLECRPDELYRAFVALSFAGLLEFERDVLMTALGEVLKRGPQSSHVN